jgi:hypothetical protein
MVVNRDKSYNTYHILILRIIILKGYTILFMLVSLVTKTNDTAEEISKRIESVNTCYEYYGLVKYFKSCLLTHKTKTRLHKTLGKPVLMY